MYCFKQYYFDGFPEASQEISASRCFTATSDINHGTRSDGITTGLILWLRLLTLEAHIAAQTRYYCICSVKAFSIIQALFRVCQRLCKAAVRMFCVKKRTG
jgi:hypothetical protein